MTSPGRLSDVAAAPPSERCFIYARTGLSVWHSDFGPVMLDGNSFLLTDCGRWSRYEAGDRGDPIVLLPSALQPIKYVPLLAGAGRDVVGQVTPSLRLLLQSLANDPADELLYHDIARAIEVSSLRLVRRQSPIIRDAKQVIQRNLTRRMPLEDVAGQLDVSPSYLTQAFKKSEGMPFYKYQLSLRLGEAMSRLPQCDDITALAYELGFSSHSHLSTALKAMIGLSPSRFRQEQARPR